MTASTKHQRHGMTKSKEYSSWHNMLTRCYFKAHISYPNYGGRGIRVCSRWKNSFVDFYADMGKMPSPNCSIDRIDNRKGYSPKNCRWATASEQAINRGIQTNNTSGVKGVCFDKQTKKWRPRVYINGKQISIGIYKNKSDAIKARDRAVKEYYAPIMSRRVTS